MSVITEISLDITMYSLVDILKLFKITDMDLNECDIRSAKRTVLSLHPDKSGLETKYFLFYKKAYDMLFQYYNETNKISRKITEENTEYSNIIPKNEDDTKKIISENIAKMSPEEYNKWFNSQFEEQMVSKNKDNVNNWFSSGEPIFDTKQHINAKDMCEEMEKIRQKNSDIIKYNGVQVLNRNAWSSLYDDDTDGYIASDPFSKLQYDDLRKVHKDQTIIAVSESDIKNIKIYKNIDELTKIRNTDKLDPIQDAQRILEENDRIITDNIKKKQFEANKKTDQYEEKNKSIISRFMRLMG